MLLAISTVKPTRMPKHIFSHSHRDGESMKPYRQIARIGHFVDADIRSGDEGLTYNIAYVPGAQKWMLVEWEKWNAPGNYQRKDLFLGFTFGYTSMQELLRCNKDLYSLGYDLGVWAQECDYHNENHA